MQFEEISMFELILWIMDYILLFQGYIQWLMVEQDLILLLYVPFLFSYLTVLQSWCNLLDPSCIWIPGILIRMTWLCLDCEYEWLDFICMLITNVKLIPFVF